MTVESCSSFCSNFQYFGLEYGGECYCGNTLPSEEAAATDCNMVCDGNANELCGAGWRLSTYENLLYNSAPSGTQTPAIAGWTYYGCVLDQGNPRTLAGDSTAAADMTLEACAAFCAGYDFFGAEYGSQCYCGYALGAAAANESAADCSMPCGGNAAEVCGAGWRLTVYEATTATSAPDPGLPATVGAYSSLGCYTDNAEGRAFPNVYYDDAALTLEECASVAAKNGATYFGAEYAQECWYGDAIGGGNAKTQTSACDMACKGNASEYCGGPNALSMYQLTAGTKLRFARNRQYAV